MNWNTLATEETLQKTTAALQANGFNVISVETGSQAKDKVLSLIPKGSAVFTNTSITANTIGLTKVINESGEYESLHEKILKMDKNTEQKRMKEIRSVPDYAIGSVHAVTEDGRLIIASRTGSQIPSYAYGADHVIWIVGTQKLVPDIEAGIKRVYEHSLKLESERANKAYNITTGSVVAKILILNKEEIKDRSTIVFVKEVLGF